MDYRHKSKFKTVVLSKKVDFSPKKYFFLIFECHNLPSIENVSKIWIINWNMTWKYNLDVLNSIYYDFRKSCPLDWKILLFVGPFVCQKQYSYYCLCIRTSAHFLVIILFRLTNSHIPISCRQVYFDIFCNGILIKIEKFKNKFSCFQKLMIKFA